MPTLVQLQCYVSFSLFKVMDFISGHIILPELMVFFSWKQAGMAQDCANFKALFIGHIIKQFLLCTLPALYPKQVLNKLTDYYSAIYLRKSRYEQPTLLTKQQ